MKRLLGLLVVLSLGFSQVLFAQTYEDGVGSYKAAHTAFLMGQKQEEREAMEEALKIFAALAKNDDKSLVMYYLLSVKLKKPFTLEELLFQYVKKEYKDFSTVESMKFCGDDKTLILDKLKEIAVQNEKQAIKLLEEAKNYAQLEDYQAALDKLQQVEKLWELDEVKTLKPKYIQLEKEKKIKSIIKKVNDLSSRGLYKDALDTLNKEKGLLPAQEFKVLEIEIKKKWAESRLAEAKKKYNAKQYYDAQSLCDEAYNIYPLPEAQELKNKANSKLQKALNKARVKAKKKPKAGFSLIGDFGSIGKMNLTNTSFSWNGNSNQFATVTDSNSVRTKPVEEKEKNFGYSFGLVGMFSPSVGIMASIGFMTQQWTVSTDYRFSWIWWDHSSASATGSMTDNAKISMKPVSLDLLVAMDIKSGMIFKLYAGPTLFLTNIDFRTRLGYGGAWPKGNYVYPEWFPFEYVTQAKEYLFGGNVGGDLEYKYTAFMSLYLGFQYFWLPEKTYNLSVIAQSYPGQIWGSLFSVGNPYDLPHLPDYRIKLNLSFYKIILGIRLYL